MIRPFAAFRPGLLLVVAVFVSFPARAQDQSTLPGTLPLAVAADRSSEMVAGIHRHSLQALTQSVEKRSAAWQRDPRSAEAYHRSVEPNRERLRRMIGAVDARVAPVTMQLVATTASPALIAETEQYQVFAVRWPVFENVHGEGLLLQPKSAPRARIVVLPDADQPPEAMVTSPGSAPPFASLAHRLAAQGSQVIVPTLLDRRDEGSGNPRLNRFTNQTHREWIYRQAFEMGRHVIGYEVQKVLAAVDWFVRENQRTASNLAVSVAGLGEGGLIAFHAAALDSRIQACLVAGYFDSRQEIWREPIYRNVFGLLREFGDAEIASLIAPRSLVVTCEGAPRVAGPPAVRDGRANTAAPGILAPPDPASVERELRRAQSLGGPEFARALLFASSGEDAFALFCTTALGSHSTTTQAIPPAPPLRSARSADERQLRQLRELETHTQRLLERAEDARQQFFWQNLKPAQNSDWRAAVRPLRERFRDEAIGPVPAPDVPLNVRTRRFGETSAWTGYEVVLDVWQDVFAWGYLLLPKDLKPGERRPVVVCQHGLEGVPEDTINPDPGTRAFGYYKAFAARLAERGFVVFSPHNPYRGRDEFRTLQRMLNPLGRTLYGVMVAQHERILDWLGTQPFVDPARIGFYGLSYGGKTALRLPALIDRYAVSICSGDFNEWIRKNTSVDLRYSYMFTGEYEIFEFNLGPTFNYGEMAALIAPRPFMVERGHNDGVGTDEWVSYEYAKVRRLYTQLGIPDRTRIEYFDGPHTIHGVGTFDFLHQHLQWPKR